MPPAAEGPALTDLGLALVYSPAQVKLEVIFIHGLNGTRSGTWTNANGELWPAWLGDSVPGSRVWTYGYNSAVWSTPTEDAMELHTARLLEECARREVAKGDARVVFVCHSLGGILAKSAIIRLLSETGDSSWSYLRERLASTIFLGTPHRGSEWANRLYILQLGTRVFWQSSQFVQLLRKGQSELLATTAERFNSLWGAKPVLSFRELKGVAPIGMIVKPRDARTNCSGEVCIDVKQNHRRLAKIESHDEVTFQSIVRHLASLGGNVYQAQAPALAGPMTAPGQRVAFGSTSDDSSRSQSLSSTAASSDTEQYQYWPKVKSRAFYSSFQSNVRGGKGWETLDEVFEPEDPPPEKAKTAFLGGTYCFSYPGHPSTTIILTIPSKRNQMQAEWTILSPNSQWHPGRHDGYFKIPNDYPFRPPQSIWNSPIISPWVNDYGRTCVDYEYDAWSPVHASFYAILCHLAAIVIFGPFLDATTEADAPEGGFRIHHLGSAIGLVSQDPEQVRRVTNLFARAYNRPEADSELDLFDGGEDDNPQSEKITEYHRQSTIHAIKDAQTVLTKINYKPSEETSRLLRAACDARGLSAPEADFAGVETLRQYLRKERQWADALNEGFGNVAAKGWKKAASYAELYG